MSWCKLYFGVERHPKTHALAEALKADLWSVVGRLFGALSYIYETNRDGSLGRLTARMIERYVNWDGASGAFIQAMINTGWLDVDEDGAPTRIHNAERYNECHRRTERQYKRRTELKNNEAPQKSTSRKTARRTKPIEPAPEPPAPQEAEVIDVRGELVEADGNAAAPVQTQRWEEREETTKNTKPKELAQGSARSKPVNPQEVFFIFKDEAKRHGLRCPLFMTPEQVDQVQTLIDAHPDRGRLGWWRGAFSEISRSQYLRGKTNGRPLSLSWLLKEENLQKVSTGFYRDRRSESTVARVFAHLTPEEVAKMGVTAEQIASWNVDPRVVGSACHAG